MTTKKFLLFIDPSTKEIQEISYQTPRSEDSDGRILCDGYWYNTARDMNMEKRMSNRDVMIIWEDDRIKIVDELGLKHDHDNFHWSVTDLIGGA